MSHDQAFDLLRDLFDPDDTHWWTAPWLITYSRIAKRVAQGRDEETRYWLTVYRELRARMA